MEIKNISSSLQTLMDKIKDIETSSLVSEASEVCQKYEQDMQTVKVEDLSKLFTLRAALIDLQASVDEILTEAIVKTEYFFEIQDQVKLALYQLQSDIPKINIGEIYTLNIGAHADPSVPQIEKVEVSYKEVLGSNPIPDECIVHFKVLDPSTCKPIYETFLTDVEFQERIITQPSTEE